MPEYLAPGVYVEETSFRSKSIEGVSTSTTGFVGPARKGPEAVGSCRPSLGGSQELAAAAELTATEMLSGWVAADDENRHWAKRPLPQRR